jgi:hypothetical protein
MMADPSNLAEAYLPKYVRVIAGCAAFIGFFLLLGVAGSGDAPGTKPMPTGQFWLFGAIAFTLLIGGLYVLEGLPKRLHRRACGRPCVGIDMK